MEGQVVVGLALVLGGFAVSGFTLWQSRRSDPAETRLWATSNRIENWLYGAGGLIAAAIGILILLDNYA